MWNNNVSRDYSQAGMTITLQNRDLPTASAWFSSWHTAMRDALQILSALSFNGFGAGITELTEGNRGHRERFL